MSLFLTITRATAKEQRSLCSIKSDSKRKRSSIRARVRTVIECRKANYWSCVIEKGPSSSYQLRGIPERSSSESSAKDDAFSFKRIWDLEIEKGDYNREAKKRRRVIKLGSSTDARFCMARRDITKKGSSSHTTLTRQI